MSIACLADACRQAEGCRKHELDCCTTVGDGAVLHCFQCNRVVSCHAVVSHTDKGKAGEGQVQKTLKWAPAEDGKVYFINASVKDKTNNTSYSASTNMTPGELYLFKRLADHAFPFLMGWTDKLQPTQ